MKRKVESVYEVRTEICGGESHTEMMTDDLRKALEEQWVILKRWYKNESWYWKDFSLFFARVVVREYKDEDNGGLFEFKCYQHYSMDERMEVTVQRHDLV